MTRSGIVRTIRRLLSPGHNVHAGRARRILLTIVNEENCAGAARRRAPACAFIGYPHKFIEWNPLSAAIAAKLAARLVAIFVGGFIGNLRDARGRGETLPCEKRSLRTRPRRCSDGTN